MPEFPLMLQIVDKDGRVVHTRAGGKQEAELVNLFVGHIISRGVGFLKTEAHVEQDIREGILAAIHSLKITNPYDLQES